MRTATLLFLIKRTDGAVSDICLAMKKRGFGEGRWNGAGGKVQEGESLEAAVVREAKEELGIDASALEKAAELHFTFPHESAFDQVVHVFLTESWTGEPGESEEMRPQWFKVRDIPYAQMWSDDILWLPLVLADKKIRGAFTFAPGDQVTAHDVAIVETL
jgi:mutator protein MutT